MRNENFTHGCAPNASVVHSESGQATVKLGQEPSILYDLVDLEKIFKVTKRTLFNWRAKGIISLIDFGGRLYMTHAMLVAHIQQRGGVI
ncbi:MAG: helix-turn-helix domain-containing protein [Paramuribaculum sp.]